jgi:hypothetical protein
MKGYKVTNNDYTCRGVKFEVGQTYTIDATPIMCERGYHFCEKVADCFNYYSFDPKNKVFEVEAVGDTVKGEDKHVTNKLLIVRELTWNEMLELANIGKGNTGINNSGNYNSGYSNSGDSNSGDSNSGDRNSGHYNSGHRNSGHFNSGNYHTGAFCTGDAEFKLFNKPTTMTRTEFYNSRAWSVLSNFSPVKWVEDKESVTGGKYVTVPYKKTFIEFWSKLSDSDKQAVKDLPNFDADVFFEITGVRV